MSRVFVSTSLALALFGIPACTHFDFASDAPGNPDEGQVIAEARSSPPGDAEAAGARPADIRPPSTPIESQALAPPTGSLARDEPVGRTRDDRVISVVRGEEGAAPNPVGEEAAPDELEGGPPAQESESPSGLLGADPAPGEAPALRGTSEFEEGLATTRGPEFTGQTTATGERFDPNLPMAAHPDMPLPSLAEIVNLENGKRMVVRVNDRQPATVDKEVTVSKSVADELGFSVNPVHVSMRYLGPAPASLDGALASTRSASVSQPSLEPGAGTVASGGNFIVQVGAFSNPMNAERLRAMLADAGQARIEATRTGGKALYRVQLGPWSDRAAAEAMRGRLIVSGYPDAVIAAR